MGSAWASRSSVAALRARAALVVTPVMLSDNRLLDEQIVEDVLLVIND